MREKFEQSPYKDLLKTKVGIWKVRTLEEPKADGIFYFLAICDECQMKSVVKADEVLTNKARCYHCKAGSK
jgi:hypothetical protein